MSPRQYLYQEIGKGWEKEQEERNVWFLIIFFKKRWQLFIGGAHAE